MHVAFSIPESEVRTWQDALAQAGVAVESRVRWEEGGESLYFRVPDRHLLELETTAWDGRELDRRIALSSPWSAADPWIALPRAGPRID